MIIEYSLASITAFLTGSIPTAYLIVKRHHKLDLRNEGSRNIGTLNAYEVTGSKRTGKTVLVLDALKGMVPVFLAHWLFPHLEALSGIALFAVVLGHNYSPWIGFKGGRGLAPAAGGMLAINPMLVGVWAAVWYLAFSLTKNVHWGNIIATIVLPVFVWLASAVAAVANLTALPDDGTLGYTTAAICGLIFIRHAKPLRDLLYPKKTN